MKKTFLLHRPDRESWGAGGQGKEAAGGPLPADRIMATVNALYPLLLLAAALAAFGVGVLLAGVSGFPPRGPVLGAEILAVAALFLAGLASR